MFNNGFIKSFQSITERKKVTNIVRGQDAMDGAGVKLRRVLGHDTVHQFDPFLMLDRFDSENPQEMLQPSRRMFGCQLWVNMPATAKMDIADYGDIIAADVPSVKDEGAEIRIVDGSYKGTKGAFEGKYVKVKYLDIKLDADAEWEYSETPNGETLFLYLLDGNLAADESLQNLCKNLLLGEVPS